MKRHILAIIAAAATVLSCLGATQDRSLEDAQLHPISSLKGLDTKTLKRHANLPGSSMADMTQMASRADADAPYLSYKIQYYYDVFTKLRSSVDVNVSTAGAQEGITIRHLWGYDQFSIDLQSNHDTGRYSYQLGKPLYTGGEYEYLLVLYHQPTETLVDTGSIEFAIGEDYIGFASDEYFACIAARDASTKEYAGFLEAAWDLFFVPQNAYFKVTTVDEIEGSDPEEVSRWLPAYTKYFTDDDGNEYLTVSRMNAGPVAIEAQFSINGTHVVAQDQVGAPSVGIDDAGNKSGNFYLWAHHDDGTYSTVLMGEFDNAYRREFSLESYELVAESGIQYRTLYKNPSIELFTPLGPAPTKPDEPVDPDVISVRYDGRYCTINTAGHNIYYTTDGTDPTTSSTLYTTPFDVGGPCTIKIYEPTTDYRFSLAAEGYYDGTKATFISGGCLAQGFLGADVYGITELTVSGPMDPVDFKFIKEDLPNLTTLTFTRGSITGIPARAFGRNVITVDMGNPSGSIASTIFDDDARVKAIIWDNNSWGIPASALSNLERKNTILYVTNLANAAGALTNVVDSESATAEKICLYDRNDFYVPTAFTAKHIEYSREFNLPTYVGIPAGWNMIQLPFDVSRFEHETKGEIKPFKANDMNLPPFWLYGPGSNGRYWPVAEIKAHQAYMISMPFSQEYATQYQLDGTVKFIGENTLVSYQLTYFDTEIGYRMQGVYDRRPPMPGQFTLNLNTYLNNGVQLGGGFFEGVEEVPAFSAYLSPISNTRARAVRIEDLLRNGAAGIEDVMAHGQNLSIVGGPGALVIDAPCDMSVAVYSISGALVRTLRLEQGPNRIDGLTPGFYIINGQKALVR